MVKLFKVNGLKKIEDEKERREMITPSLREALTKQGEFIELERLYKVQQIRYNDHASVVGGIL